MRMFKGRDQSVGQFGSELLLCLEFVQGYIKLNVLLMNSEKQMKGQIWILDNTFGVSVDFFPDRDE